MHPGYNLGCRHFWAMIELMLVPFLACSSNFGGKRSKTSIRSIGGQLSVICLTCSRQYCRRFSRSVSRWRPWKKNSANSVPNIPADGGICVNSLAPNVVRRLTSKYADGDHDVHPHPDVMWLARVFAAYAGGEAVVGQTPMEGFA